MILLRFAKNDQNAEYATTTQTLADANRCINNLTNTLKEHNELESMKKAGNNYYEYRLTNGDSLHLYVSKPQKYGISSNS